MYRIKHCITGKPYCCAPDLELHVGDATPVCWCILCCWASVIHFQAPPGSRRADSRDRPNSVRSSHAGQSKGGKSAKNKKVLSWYLTVTMPVFTEMISEMSNLTIQCSLVTDHIFLYPRRKSVVLWYGACRPSVLHTFFTMFPSLYHHEIFRSYYQWQKWCPCKRSRLEVKGQGHRGQKPI